MKQPSQATAYEKAPLLGLEREAITNPAMLKGVSIGSRAAYLKPMPRAIGHRGFKAAAPENTIAAFKAATEAGAEALETDLHLTRDGVVVLCHDETLQRCYGNKARVRDLDWAEISKLRTLRAPHQPMPRLIDLLEYLNQPGLERMQLMLDIKTHDDAEEIMKKTAEALASVSSLTPWSTRVTPCCWNATYIKLSMKYLPSYPITHVGFSTTYARCLTHIPNISFSMQRHALASPCGGRFLRDMKRLGIPVHVWTVNEEGWMEWSIEKELSGVITDEVALFREVCNRTGSDEVRTPTTSSRQKNAFRIIYQNMRFWVEIALVHLLITLFQARQWLKYGSPRRHINRELNGI